MEYKILDLSQRQEWTKYLQKLPIDQQDIYFTPEYYSLYENYGDGKAQCFVLEQDYKIALYPFLLNSVNELGYDLDDEYYDIQGAYGYNGVISSTYDKNFINEFYNSYGKYCHQKNIFAEFTRFNPYLRNHLFAERHLDVLLNRKTVVLDLNQPYEKIWDNSYSSRNRNMIRKANKNCFNLIIDNSIVGSNRFYDTYLETMKMIDAKPYYYFNRKYFEELVATDHYNFLFVTDCNQNIFATMILIVFGKYAHYHLSGRTKNNNDNSVNNFMLDEAIKIARERGAKIFHFGGGNSLDEKDSLFKFKSNFSKDYLDFYIGKRIHNQKIYDAVIRQWEEKNPTNKRANRNVLLRYRTES